jgi:16S rRNA (cytosine1402-N4)-methyltransferase
MTSQIPSSDKTLSLAPGALTNAHEIKDAVRHASAQSVHEPVLLDDCVRLMTPALENTGSIAVDCTLGMAGHSQAFLQAAPKCRLVGIDRDHEALAFASERLKPFQDRVTLVHSSFDHFSRICDDLEISQVSAVFLDLGLSSLQIDEQDRGFTYSADAPLDMRMDSSTQLTAADILASYSEGQLEYIFHEYGQEKWARKIAGQIVRTRADHPLTSTRQLEELVDRAVPRKGRPAGNPAKRVFQALRIEVNGELDELAHVFPQILDHLAVGGRIVVEAYHSLEDKIVKSFFRLGDRPADVPLGLPVIPDDLRPYFTDLTRGAIKADDAEKARNPRSSSVRLRAVELIRPVPDHAASDIRRWLQSYDRANRNVRRQR